ncbi:MAG: winged helix-turn-helix domain-containing protein [bacterium]|nr:winged helix-turn-helix domain-containing protein [bacterium]
MLSKTEAAYKILKEAKKPLYVGDIIKTALAKKLIKTKGKTPDSTLAVDMLLENRRRAKQGVKPRFVKVAPATWGLTEWE